MLKQMLLFTCMIALTSIQASEIQVSAYANSGQVALIKSDLEYLKSIHLNPQDSQFLIKVMQLKPNETLSSWLEDRVNYIIEEDFFNKPGFFKLYPLVREKKNVSYPNGHIYPEALEAILGDFLNMELFEDSLNNTHDSSTIVMTNIGTSLYIQGKLKKELLALRFTENKSLFKKKIEITSPRVGVIQIGTGLFQPNVRPNPLYANALSNKLHRISIFLHEARHSDGNGKTLGFIHAKCPPGHNYAGKNACDTSANGPYIIGAQAAVDAIKWCGDQCSIQEKTMLRATALDSFSRVINPTKENMSKALWDETPEFIK